MQPMQQEAQGAPAQGGGDLQELMGQGMEILTKIGTAMQAAGAPPEKMKQIVALAKAFEMFASGEADKPAPQGPGAATMEAGANPNARPAL
jgi:hypothetical protein